MEPTGQARRGRCRRCGAALMVPAAEPGARLTLAERRKQRRPLLAPAVVVAVVSFLLGLVAVPLTVLAGAGTAVAATSGEASSGDVGLAFYLVAVLGLLALGLVGGGIGLLLRQSWGWWAETVVYGFFLLLNLKLCLPLLRLNWDHPRAGETALAFGLQHGLPIAVSLAMLILLFLPRMRVAYGVKQEKRLRPRRA
ncbi:MAG: hypothetical protein AAF682_10030 [Planctomycetota bacterium]